MNLFGQTGRAITTWKSENTASTTLDKQLYNILKENRLSSDSLQWINSVHLRIALIDIRHLELLGILIF